MSSQKDLESIARLIVDLRDRHNAFARAAQAAHTSVTLPSGGAVDISDAVEAATDAAQLASYTAERVETTHDNLDGTTEYSVSVPELVRGATDTSDVLWDSTQYATDLAMSLEAELSEARLELAQAQVDLAQAMQDAQDALDAADGAVVVANGKNKTYFLNTEPSGGVYNEGDIWVNPSNGNLVSIYDGTAFVESEFGAEALASGSVVASKISAGAVTSEKLFAGSVTTDKLAANSVVAGKIAASAITGEKIAAEAIDGMVITGALVRTAPTGQRVQLDTNGLRAFNSDNVAVSTVASDGTGLKVTGPLITSSVDGYNTGKLDSGVLQFTANAPSGWAKRTDYGVGGVHQNLDIGLYFSNDSNEAGTGSIITSGSGSNLSQVIVLTGAGNNGDMLKGKVSLRAHTVDVNGRRIDETDIDHSTVVKAPGYTLDSSSFIRVRGDGYVYGMLTINSVAGGFVGATTLITLPAEARHAQSTAQEFTAWASQGGNVSVNFAQILSNGVVRCYSGSTGSLESRFKLVITFAYFK